MLIDHSICTYHLFLAKDVVFFSLNSLFIEGIYLQLGFFILDTLDLLDPGRLELSPLPVDHISL